MNDENEGAYDQFYRRPNQNKHEGVRMKGMLPTEVSKPQAEAPMKCGTLKALPLQRNYQTRELALNAGVVRITFELFKQAKSSP